jgi:hypothetical protein
MNSIEKRPDDNKLLRDDIIFLFVNRIYAENSSEVFHDRRLLETD